ncbi:hypothetical protein WJX72_004527 [[Myrmecia] bisecta]|uniref:Ysc84 actin-binding domain-containing protein n=1 Tax=[Myrmecia] bisecta TaxID=41462 RepID=A0AAW1PXS0_9CHLO
MTTPTSDEHPDAHDIIPRKNIRDAKGVQFVVSRLRGLGLSYLRGRCIVFKKLGKDQWSAPLFSSINSIGFGLTAGYDVIETIAIMGTEEVLEKFKKGGPRFHVDLDVIAGRNSPVAQSGTDIPLVPYTIAGGALIDFSFKGGAATMDKKRNEATYGRSVTPAQVLDGQVEPPAEFEELYELLNKLGHTHQA